MLKNIDPLLGPKLLEVLRAMGHGDDLCLVDANFPAQSVAANKPLVRMDGVAMKDAANAISRTHHSGSRAAAAAEVAKHKFNIIYIVVCCRFILLSEDGPPPGAVQPGTDAADNGGMTLHRLPRQLPPMALILADLGHPTSAVLGKALGVSERTVWRWRAADSWPHSAALALFFSSRWGWSVVESEAVFTLRNAAALTEALQRENAALRERIERLVSTGDFGSANAPLWAVR